MGVGPRSGSCVKGAWGSWGQSRVRQLGLVAWLALSPPGLGGLAERVVGPRGPGRGRGSGQGEGWLAK